MIRKPHAQALALLSHSCTRHIAQSVYRAHGLQRALRLSATHVVRFSSSACSGLVPVSWLPQITLLPARTALWSRCCSSRIFALIRPHGDRLDYEQAHSETRARPRPLNGKQRCHPALRLHPLTVICPIPRLPPHSLLPQLYLLPHRPGCIHLREARPPVPS